MSKNTKPPRKSRKASERQKGAKGAELSEKQLDNVTGGAVDAFIWIESGPGDERRQQQQAFEIKDFSFGAKA